MTQATGIIDSLATPPLSLLQQVLDDLGPYGAGDVTLSDFHTSGGFLLPAGTYSVSGTYGVIVQASLFPAIAGRELGWNDATFPTISGDTYFDRIAQLCVLHQLPTTGAYVISSTHDIFLASQLVLWPGLIGGPAKLGLHVFPNFAVDLFYMCIG